MFQEEKVRSSVSCRWKTLSWRWRGSRSRERSSWRTRSLALEDLDEDALYEDEHAGDSSRLVAEPELREHLLEIRRVEIGCRFGRVDQLKGHGLSPGSMSLEHRAAAASRHSVWERWHPGAVASGAARTGTRVLVPSSLASGAPRSGSVRAGRACGSASRRPESDASIEDSTGSGTRVDRRPAAP